MGIVTNSFGTLAIQGTIPSPLGGIKTRRHTFNTPIAASAFGTRSPGGRLAVALSHRATIDFSGNRKQPNQTNPATTSLTEPIA